MPEQYKRRIRTNISTTSKGLKSYDLTVELIDATDEEHKALLAEWVAYMDKTYPAGET